MIRLQDKRLRRGEFIRGDGLVIPNNVSIAGAVAVLASAFQGVDPGIYMGLVNGAPSLTMTQNDATEPTIGVSGYARQAMARGSSVWAVLGTAGNEAFIESAFVTFAAVSTPFDQEINRIALFNTAIRNPAAPILAMSEVIVPSIAIAVDTPIENRRFKYRFYI